VNPQKRRQIFERLRAANPAPTTELEYGTPFELLVAVVLSAQATDKSVNLATRKLFPATPRKIADLGTDKLDRKEIPSGDHVLVAIFKDQDRERKATKKFSVQAGQTTMLPVMNLTVPEDQPPEEPHE